MMSGLPNFPRLQQQARPSPEDLEMQRLPPISATLLDSKWFDGVPELPPMDALKAFTSSRTVSVSRVDEVCFESPTEGSCRSEKQAVPAGEITPKPSSPESDAKSDLVDETGGKRDYWGTVLLQPGSRQEHILSSLRIRPAIAKHQRGIGMNNLDSSFTCKTCKQKFATQELLNDHVLSRCSKSRERPFVCTECGAAFRKNSNLVKHISLVELKLRPFACHLCDAKFGQKSNLTSHIRVTHNGERPFACTHPGCMRRFGQRSGLRAHVDTVHLGERKFVCDCGAAFGHRGDLNRHIRTRHEKLLPFTCHHCPTPRSFGRKSVLQRHIANLHPDVDPKAVTNSRS